MKKEREIKEEIINNIIELNAKFKLHQNSEISDRIRRTFKT
jgi:hypothetical protein